jgi:type IV fimbrial biogenesis protein FimT
MTPAAHRIRPRSRRDLHSLRGLTAVEMMCTLAVLAVAGAAAFPRFEQWRDDTALAGLAARVEAVIQLARSQTVRRGQPVRLTLGNADPGSCLMLHTGQAEDCRCAAGQAPQCEAGAELLHADRIDARERAQLRANVDSILFDGDRGTSTPAATLRLVTPQGRALHTIVNLTGRVRSCSPGARIAGYRGC